MKVRFLQNIGGHDVDDVAELSDGDAEFLFSQGYVTDEVDGSVVLDPSDETGLLPSVDAEGHTAEVDVAQRADRHSGKGSVALPDDAEPVVVEGSGFGVSVTQSNPFEDTHSDEGDHLDGLTLRELKSLAESMDLPTSGTKADLQARIHDAETA
jgi:hypothetical protein